MAAINFLSGRDDSASSTSSRQIDALHPSAIEVIASAQVIKVAPHGSLPWWWALELQTRSAALESGLLNPDGSINDVTIGFPTDEEWANLEKRHRAR